MPDAWASRMRVVVFVNDRDVYVDADNRAILVNEIIT